MRPIQHIVASGVMGTTLYVATKDPLAATACFFSGWLVDIDHLIDWYLNFGTDTNLSLYYYFGTHKIRRISILLHGWEHIIALLALYILYQNQLVLGILLGYSLHIVLDATFNRPSGFLTYSLIYRLLNGFKTPKLFRF